MFSIPISIILCIIIGSTVGYFLHIIFENLYKKSDETFRYIGEWHTHPEAIPNFSYLDLKNWKKISKDSKSDVKFYHIIVGYEAIRIWEINNTLQVRLINTIFWKDVGGN